LASNNDILTMRWISLTSLKSMVKYFISLLITEILALPAGLTFYSFLLKSFLWSCLRFDVTAYIFLHIQFWWKFFVYLGIEFNGIYHNLHYCTAVRLQRNSLSCKMIWKSIACGSMEFGFLQDIIWIFFLLSYQHLNLNTTI
jgi:hypothetical protein